MIYDCFTFFNELDLLELRLNELNDVVDKFVLVEATMTHQKKEKPLYYELNKTRFEDFSDKIIHIIVKDYPTFYTHFRKVTNWDYERNQRNYISKGLVNCKPEDVIIISDIDEIPDPEKIIQFKDKPGIKLFRQKMFYYFFNCINASDIDGRDYDWIGSVMLFYGDLTKPQHFRDLTIRFAIQSKMNLKGKIYWFIKRIGNKHLKRDNILFIDNGGWHFSYLGGVEKILSKIESFAHAEYNIDQYKDRDSIEKAINSGDDIFGRRFKYKFIKLDNSFPKYLLNNIQKFNNLIKF